MNSDAHSFEILLVGREDRWGARAKAIAQEHGEGRIYTRLAKHDERRLPDQIYCSSMKILISFMSKWIFPLNFLEKFSSAINIHPGSRDYPGFGCYNFAIYDGVTEYGSTCHYMDEKIDSGKIIEERRFDICVDETVERLKLKTMTVALAQLETLIRMLAITDSPPPNGLSWSREATTRKTFDQLRRISEDLQPEEIERRRRAFDYPRAPGVAWAKGDGFIEEFGEDRPPIA